MLVGHVVDEDYASSTFVVSVGQRAELDLPSRVPNRHLHSIIAVHDIFLLVIDPSCPYQITLEDAI